MILLLIIDWYFYWMIRLIMVLIPEITNLFLSYLFGVLNIFVDNC
jgi:hypothetical protein